MPRAGAPPWKQLKEPVMDPYVQAAINATGGQHDAEGWYGTLIITGAETKERAAELKQGLFRAAFRMKVSVKVTVHLAGDGTYNIEYRVSDKSFARKRVVDRFGPDPRNWPYNPWAKGKPND